MQASFFISGTPATFATSREKAWKEAIKTQSPAPTLHGKETGLCLRFVLDTLTPNGQGRDLDNLCEPVFSALINGVGWFHGRRSYLMWFSATMETGTRTGCRVEILADPRCSIPDYAPRYDGLYSGPLPSNAKSPEVADWARSLQRARGDAPEYFQTYSLYLGFADSGVNIGDIATGRVKSFIDCLYPWLGGCAGAPEDFRIRRLTVEKGLSSLATGTVEVKLWADEMMMGSSAPKPSKQTTHLEVREH